MLGELVADVSARRAEYGRRSKGYDEETFEKPLREVREAEGWVFQRENTKPRKVLFRDREVSPSAAALTVIHEMGYDWPKVSGMDYWQFDGIRLSDLGDREADDSDAE